MNYIKFGGVILMLRMLKSGIKEEKVFNIVGVKASTICISTGMIYVKLSNMKENYNLENVKNLQ